MQLGSELKLVMLSATGLSPTRVVKKMSVSGKHIQN